MYLNPIFQLGTDVSHPLFVFAWGRINISKFCTENRAYRGSLKAIRGKLVCAVCFYFSLWDILLIHWFTDFTDFTYSEISSAQHTPLYPLFLTWEPFTPLFPVLIKYTLLNIDHNGHPLCSPHSLLSSAAIAMATKPCPAAQNPPAKQWRSAFPPRYQGCKYYRLHHRRHHIYIHDPCIQPTCNTEPPIHGKTNYISVSL